LGAASPTRCVVETGDQHGDDTCHRCTNHGAYPGSVTVNGCPFTIDDHGACPGSVTVNGCPFTIDDHGACPGSVTVNGCPFTVDDLGIHPDDER